EKKAEPEKEKPEPEKKAEPKKDIKPEPSEPLTEVRIEGGKYLNPEDIEKAISENLDIIIETQGNAYWTIHPSDIDAEKVSSMSRMNLDISECDLDILEEVMKAGESVQNNQKLYSAFDILHNGSFGFEAYLTMVLENAGSGNYANLYHLDPYEMTLDYVDSSLIDENGEATFRMSHASHYVIFTSKMAMTQESVGELVKYEEPDSDDDEPVILNNTPAKKKTNPLKVGFMIIVVATILIIIAARKYKKKDHIDL
ncbi:MAG: hypothetical protein Q4D29_09995, partial [Lachnospiraceae bacterium]|nr:hypothetical protein [Lachnospiraceae bacterium]